VGTYGGASTAVEYLIRRAGQLTIDEAADIYRARASWLLVEGHEVDRHALLNAVRTAVRTGRLPEYERARRAAVSAWRGALPAVEGPWLMVGSAIGNAAGALVLEEVLDKEDFLWLIGPWRQAIGTMVPVGPGQRVREPTGALTR
jgi:hypothetical protein